MWWGQMCGWKKKSTISLFCNPEKLLPILVEFSQQTEVTSLCWQSFADKDVFVSAVWLE